MVNENQNRRPLEWVVYKDDPNAVPMYVKGEGDENVDLQVPGTTQVVLNISKDLLMPADNTFELGGLYGMPNVRYSRKQEDGTFKDVPPIDPTLPGTIGATVAYGHIITTLENADGSLEGEDLNGKKVLLDRADPGTNFRKLPGPVLNRLLADEKVAAQLRRIKANQPMTEEVFKKGSRGYTLRKTINGREVYQWPETKRGTLGFNQKIGPCVVVSTLNGFNGEVDGKVNPISFVDGQIQIGKEIRVGVLERRKIMDKNTRKPIKDETGKEKTYLHTNFMWMDESFKAQLTRDPGVVELLKKLQPVKAQK